MLGNAPFGFGLLRIYTALMGSCVDNIYIERSLSPDYTPNPSESELDQGSCVSIRIRTRCLQD